jgi:predicted alpha/beta-hydrolase family hydrolase
MSSSDCKLATIVVDDAIRVSGLVQRPAQARACLVLAHGAGAGMRHPFLAAMADELAQLGIATLRYQFRYMEQGLTRPDSAALCHATVRAAVAAAHGLVPELPLIAGGKSFGGRMTSQAHAAAPLPEVRGLLFMGFPLHPPRQPSNERARHLAQVRIPMLFLQGARDAFAQPSLLQPVIDQLGKRATLVRFPDADHSFHVPARSGRTDAQIRRQMAQTLAAWTDSVIPDCQAGSAIGVATERAS